MSTPTIHNSARKGEIAQTVLMPGDPVRAKYIAENYLQKSRLVNEVRCAYAYTGEYMGEQVSVMASGMGSGSMGIYSHELYQDYGVERIIRVGSAGGLGPQVRLGTILVAISASTDSGYAKHLDLPGDFAPTVSDKLLRNLIEIDRQKQGKLNLLLGSVFSGAAFHYSQDFFEKWYNMGVLAVEMESAALYINAAKLHKEALAMFTISDMIFSGEKYSTQEREMCFGKMIEVALELSIT